MTLEDVLRDIHAMREDLLVFERKYGIPTEIFYAAYQSGEEPADSTWVLDWSDWAGAYEILQDRLAWYHRSVEQLLHEVKIASFSQLVERTARHEPLAVSA